MTSASTTTFTDGIYDCAWSEFHDSLKLYDPPSYLATPPPSVDPPLDLSTLSLRKWSDLPSPSLPPTPDQISLSTAPTSSSASQLQHSPSSFALYRPTSPYHRSVGDIFIIDPDNSRCSSSAQHNVPPSPASPPRHPQLRPTSSPSKSARARPQQTPQFLQTPTIRPTPIPAVARPIRAATTTSTAVTTATFTAPTAAELPVDLFVHNL